MFRSALRGIVPSLHVASVTLFSACTTQFCMPKRSGDGGGGGGGGSSSNSSTTTTTGALSAVLSPSSMAEPRALCDNAF